MRRRFFYALVVALVLAILLIVDGRKAAATDLCLPDRLYLACDAMDGIPWVLAGCWLPPCNINQPA